MLKNTSNNTYIYIVELALVYLNEISIQFYKLNGLNPKYGI